MEEAQEAKIPDVWRSVPHICANLFGSRKTDLANIQQYHITNVCSSEQTTPHLCRPTRTTGTRNSIHGWMKIKHFQLRKVHLGKDACIGSSYTECSARNSIPSIFSWNFFFSLKQRTKRGALQMSCCAFFRATLTKVANRRDERARDERLVKEVYMRRIVQSKPLQMKSGMSYQVQFLFNNQKVAAFWHLIKYCSRWIWEKAAVGETSSKLHRFFLFRRLKRVALMNLPSELERKIMFTP